MAYCESCSKPNPNREREEAIELARQLAKEQSMAVVHTPEGFQVQTLKVAIDQGLPIAFVVGKQ